MHGRLDRRNETAFSNFSGEMCTVSELSHNIA